jgi:hypothetical protein
MMCGGINEIRRSVKGNHRFIGENQRWMLRALNGKLGNRIMIQGRLALTIFNEIGASAWASWSPAFSSVKSLWQFGGSGWRG